MFVAPPIMMEKPEKRPLGDDDATSSSGSKMPCAAGAGLLVGTRPAHSSSGILKSTHLNVPIVVVMRYKFAMSKFSMRESYLRRCMGRCPQVHLRVLVEHLHLGLATTTVGLTIQSAITTAHKHAKFAPIASQIWRMAPG